MLNRNEFSELQGECECPKSSTNFDDISKRRINRGSMFFFFRFVLEKGTDFGGDVLLKALRSSNF